MAQTAEQQAVTLVLGPDDDLTTLRALRSLHVRPFGQIVCEPPTSSAADLAHHLLAALGKSAGDPDGAWRRARALLRGERIDHIVLLRAQILSYPALRRLADTAQAAHSRLWIIAVGESATRPVRQLLEERPHTTAHIDHALATLAIDIPDDEQLPADHGDDFPLLACAQHRAGRGDLLRGLRPGRRTVVSEAFDDTHAWMTAWADEHPDPYAQAAADAIYRVARRLRAPPAKRSSGQTAAWPRSPPPASLSEPTRSTVCSATAGPRPDQPNTTTTLPAQPRSSTAAPTPPRRR